MPMTQSHLKVFVARIEEIAQGKLADYKERNKEPKRNLSNKEMFEEFKAGRYTIKKDVENERGYSVALDQVCVFEKQAQIEKVYKDWQRKGRDYRIKIFSEQRKILDMAHFGEVSEALEMIHKFQCL